MRQDAMTTIANNTGLSQSEVQNMVDRYQALYQQTVNDIEATVEEVSGNVADAVAAAAGAAFIALLAGAFAAGAGGLVGGERATDAGTARTRTVRRSARVMEAT
jgi:hypothetical protein